MKREGWGGLYMSAAVCSIFALSLTGCATSPPEPRIVVKEVPVAVQVKCTPKIDKPTGLPETDAAFRGDVYDLAKLYRAGILLYRAYVGQLEAGLKECAG